MYRVSFQHYTTHVPRPLPRSPLDARHQVLHLTALSPALPLLPATRWDVFGAHMSTTQHWQEPPTFTEGFPPGTLPGCPTRPGGTVAFQMAFLQAKVPAKIMAVLTAHCHHCTTDVHLPPPCATSPTQDRRTCWEPISQQHYNCKHSLSDTR